MRINGFDQIKALYSIVFEQRHEFKPQHISLYVFLINQNNRNNWVEWFKCPYDLAMAGACIGNKKTYYNCLADLQEWGMLEYVKGSNEWKAPKIKLEVLKCTSTVPQSVPLPIPQGTPLPTPQGTPQGTKRYKPITINQITNNQYRKFAHLSISFDEVDSLKNQGYTMQEINSILDAIENYKKNTNYKSLFLTAKKWLEKEKSSAKKEKSFIEKAAEIIHENQNTPLIVNSFF